MKLLVPVDPRTPCDRCTHEVKWHAPPEERSECRKAVGPKVAGARAKQCFCDGYVLPP